MDGPDNNPISTAEDVFLHLINNARRSVHITTPYLAIDEPMRQALCSAGDSGVDVRLLLPGIPDHKFAYLAAQSHYGELLVHRVKIYIYEPGSAPRQDRAVRRRGGLCGVCEHGLPQLPAAL